MVKLKAWVSGKMGPYRIITSNFLGKIKSTVAWWWHTLVWSAEQAHFIKYLLENKDFSVHLLLSCLSFNTKWIITFSYRQYKSRSPLPCNELLIIGLGIRSSVFRLNRSLIAIEWSKERFDHGQSSSKINESEPIPSIFKKIEDRQKWFDLLT